MSKAPKKIWYDPQAGFADEEQQYPEDILYIRADIVDELVEALERLARLGNGNNYGNSIGNEIARAALAKLEESHD